MSSSYTPINCHALPWMSVPHCGHCSSRSEEKEASPGHGPLTSEWLRESAEWRRRGRKWRYSCQYHKLRSLRQAVNLRRYTHSFFPLPPHTLPRWSAQRWLFPLSHVNCWPEPCPFGAFGLLPGRSWWSHQLEFTWAKMLKRWAMKYDLPVLLPR